MTKLRVRGKKKRLNGSDWAMIVTSVLLAAFIVVMIVTYWRFQSVPDSLIAGVMGAGGLEFGALAKMYVEKKRNGDK